MEDVNEIPNTTEEAQVVKTETVVVKNEKIETPESKEPEFNFEKVFKTFKESAVTKMVCDKSMVVGLIRSDMVDTEYLEKFYKKDPEAICGKGKNSYILKLQDLSTRVKIETGTLSVDPEIVENVMKGLEKAGFANGFYTAYYRKDVPFLFMDDQGNTIVVAPRVEE